MAYYYKKMWTPETCRKYPTYLFIFGDNDVGRGKAGQAVIRDEPNAMGIPTKKEPSTYLNAFYTDREYASNIEKIRDAIESIKKQLDDYDAIMYPYNGIGTGLSQLEDRAPKTYTYLMKQIRALLKYAKAIKKVKKE
jgi:hypothetical protein